MVQNLLLTVTSLGSSAKRNKSLNVHTYCIQHKAAFCLVICWSRSLYFTLNSQPQQVPLCWLHVLLSSPLCFAKGHVFSLGSTLSAALSFVIEPELEAELGEEIQKLLEQMQEEKPEDRPLLQVRTPCPLIVFYWYREIKKTLCVLALWGSCRKMKDLCWAVFR